MTQTCLRIITGAMRKLGVLAIGREPTAAQGEEGMIVLQSIYLELVGQGVFGRLYDTKIEGAAPVVASALVVVTPVAGFFGPRYFGARYFAPRYFGVGTSVVATAVAAAPVASLYTAHEQERVTIVSTATTVTIPTSITAELDYGDYGPIDGPRDYGWSMWAPVFPRPPRDNAIIQVARSDLGSALTYIYDAPRATWAVLEGLVLADIAPLSERYGEALKSLLALKLASAFNVQPNPILMGEYARANSILSTRFDRSHRPASGQYM